MSNVANRPGPGAAQIKSLRSTPADALGAPLRVISEAFRQAELRAAGRYASLLTARSFARVGTLAEPARSGVSSILIKPVGDRCNLRCSYCYEASHGGAVVRMSQEILRSTIEAAILLADHEVHFMWHGGEPLLAGLRFFESAMALQRKLVPHGLKIRNTVQTNATLINGAWARFFARERFSIGVSIDGPQSLHDQGRRTSSGGGSFQAVRKGLEDLRACGVSYGGISVIQRYKPGDPGELVHTLRDLEVISFDVHPNFGAPTTGEADVLAPKDYVAYMCELFEEWLKHGDPSVRVGTFDEAFLWMIREEPFICYNAGACSQVIAVDASGDVTPCTRPFDKSLYTFGNVQNDGNLMTIAQSASAKAFSSADRRGQRARGHCPWFTLCHGGCPQHRVDRDGRQDVAGEGFYCDCGTRGGGGMGSLWTYVVGRVQQLVSEAVA